MEIHMNPEIIRIILGKIPQSTLLQIAIGPFMDLYDAYMAIEQHRKFELRYVLNILVIMLGLMVGLALPYFLPDIYMPLINKVLGPYSNILTAYTFSAWLWSYPTSGLVQFLSGSYLLYKYGDTKYYLDAERRSLLAHVCGVEPNKVQSLFNYLLSNLRDGKVVLHSGAGSISDVLEAFMYGNKTKIREYYHLHIGFYEASLVKHSNCGVTTNIAKMRELADLYGVEPEDIIEVIRYCTDRIYEEKDSIANRKEDYAEFIDQILTGNITTFLVQQQLALQQKLEIEKLKKSIDSLHNIINGQQPITASSSSDYELLYGDDKGSEHSIRRKLLEKYISKKDPQKGTGDLSTAALSSYLAHCKEVLKQTESDEEKKPKPMEHTLLDKFKGKLFTEDAKLNFTKPEVNQQSDILDTEQLEYDKPTAF